MVHPFASARVCWHQRSAEGHQLTPIPCSQYLQVPTVYLQLPAAACLHPQAQRALRPPRTLPHCRSMAALTTSSAHVALCTERRQWAARQQAPAVAPVLAQPRSLAPRRAAVRPAAAATALAPATISSAKLDRRLEAAQRAVLDAIAGVEGRGKGGMTPEQQVRSSLLGDRLLRAHSRIAAGQVAVPVCSERVGVGRDWHVPASLHCPALARPTPAGERRAALRHTPLCAVLTYGAGSL